MAFIVNDPRFLRLWRVNQSDIEPAFGHVKVRQDKLRTLRVTIYH